MYDCLRIVVFNIVTNTADVEINKMIWHRFKLLRCIQCLSLDVFALLIDYSKWQFHKVSPYAYKIKSLALIIRRSMGLCNPGGREDQCQGNHSRRVFVLSNTYRANAGVSVYSKQARKSAIFPRWWPWKLIALILPYQVHAIGPCAIVGEHELDWPDWLNWWEWPRVSAFEIKLNPHPKTLEPTGKCRTR